MYSRRSFLLFAAACPAVLSFPSLADNISVSDPPEFLELEYPSLDLINQSTPFGTKPPDKQQYEKAKAIWENAPKGNSPLGVAEYFLGFEKNDPDVITQWPSREAWNPLIVEFFRATNYRAKNDQVPWCSAFVNWCLKRTGKTASGDPASQSFLDEKFFERTSSPKVGDLVVFTCYNKSNDQSVGLGHVAFLAEVPKESDTHVMCLGGNQTNKGNSMICKRQFRIANNEIKRTINGKKISVNMRLNTYIRIV